jgi:hypothetical protein
MPNPEELIDMLIEPKVKNTLDYINNPIPLSDSINENVKLGKKIVQEDEIKKQLNKI